MLIPLIRPLSNFIKSISGRNRRNPGSLTDTDNNLHSQSNTNLTAINHPPSLLMMLEPRIMLDGAAVATATEVAALHDDDSSITKQTSEQEPPAPPNATTATPQRTEHPVSAADQIGELQANPAFHSDSERLFALTEQTPQALSASLPEPDERQEIIFIDAAVTDYQAFAEDVKSNPAIDYQVFILEDSSSGLNQIARHLSELEDVDAVHLVTHGSSNGFSLGNTWLDLNSLENDPENGLATIIGQWQSALSNDADILIYGCNLAADPQGQQLLAELSELTGSDVAASVDDTGAITLGGNWNLEYSLGDIDSAIAFSEAFQQQWQHLLTSAPVIVNNQLTIAEGGAVFVTSDMISATDADTDDSLLEFNISGVSNGQFEFSTLPGDPITNFNQEKITTGNVIFVHDGSQSAPTFSLGVSDGANNVGDFAGSITFNIGDDANLWLTTDGNVNPGNGVPGLDAGSWKAGDLLALGEPGFSLGNPTAGYFAVPFQIDDYSAGANINAIHYVTQAITVGSANAVNLQPGDIVLSTSGNPVFTSNGAGAPSPLPVSQQDLFYFRPDNADDYSKGNFYMLIESPLGQEIRGVSLVEQNTLIGDRMVDQGDLLLARSGPSQHSSVWLFEMNGVDLQNPDTYPTITTPLIEGNDANIDIDEQIWGIELIEADITVGGEALTSGDILLSFDKDDTDGIGSNSITTVTQFDIARLQVSATTLVAGADKASAVASIIYQGADVNFDDKDEIIDGFTITTAYTPNTPPTGTGSLTTTELDDNVGPVNLFADLNVSDPDAGEDDLQLRITLSDPATGTISGGGFTDQGGGVYETPALFTVADANTALENAQFTPIDNSSEDGFTTTDISVDVDDQGGAGYQPVLVPTTVTITRINDAPVLTLDQDNSSGAGGGGYQDTFIQGASPIAIADSDTVLTDLDSTDYQRVDITASGLVDGNNEKLILDGTDFLLATEVSEQITSGGIYRVTLTTGTGTANLLIERTDGGTGQKDMQLTRVQNLIKAIRYQHTDGSSPGLGNRFFDITVNDDVDDSAPVRSTISVQAAPNTNPTGAGSLTTTSLNDNSGAMNLFGSLTVSDPDGEDDLQLKITLSDPGAGTISGGGFTHQGSGIYTTTATLTVATANSALDAVQFTPTNNTGDSGDFNSDISIDVNDQGGGGHQQVLPATEVTITRINDAPTVDLDAFSGGADFNVTFTEGDGPTPIANNDASVDDVDSSSFTHVSLAISGILDGNDEILELEGTAFGLATDVASQDTISYSVSVSTGAETASFVISKKGGGDLAETEAETLIRALRYQHTDNADPTDGNRAIAVSINDGIVEGPAATSTLNVNSVDDAPALTLNNLTISQGGAIPVTTGHLSTVDPDTADSNLTYSVTGISHGQFELASAPGVAITSFNVTQVIAGQVIFAHDGGAAAPVYSISVSDGISSSGPMPANITFSPANDATLWLTTTDNTATGNGVNGLTARSWDSGDLLTLGPPSLTLGDPTAGLFGVPFEIENFASGTGINAIHYVTQSVTLGTANSVTLQAEDIILAASGSATFTSNGVGAPADLTVGSADLFYFRPDTPGDYSKGNFYSLINNPLGAAIQGVSLVEQNTLIEDYAVAQGDLLFASGGADDDRNDIWLFESSTTDLGAPATFPAKVNRLIEGEDLDIQEAISGLELVESATSAGGVALDTGDFLITLSQEEDDVGDNELDVTRFDILQLDVSATTLGSGGNEASATASLFLKGADLNLDNSSENINGFSLAQEQTNTSPTGSGALSATTLNDNAGDTALFAGLTVIDPDVEGDLVLKITLGNPGVGALSTTGFTLSEGPAGVYTLDGLTVVQANTALDNILFTPVDNTGPDGSFSTNISVEVDDQGGGGFQAMLAPATLTIDRINDNPTGSGALTTTTLDDNAGATNLFSNLTVSDQDTGEDRLKLQITLSSPAAGIIDGGGFTSQGGGVYESTTDMTVAEANAALDAVQFTPTNNIGPADSFSTDISVKVSDQRGGGFQQVLSATEVTINQINDNPTGSGSLTTTTLNDNAGPTNLFANLTVTDPDAAENTLKLRITLSDPAAGIISGGGFIDQGGGIYETTATLTQVATNTALDNVQFFPTDNTGPSGSFTTNISVDVDDQRGGGLQQVLAPTEVTIDRINDAPVANNDAFTTDEDTATGGDVLADNGSGADTDPDGDTLAVAEVNGSAANVGTQITLASGVLLSANSDGTFGYDPNGQFESLALGESATDSFTYTLSDGNGGTDTATVIITIAGLNGFPTGSGTLTTTSLNDNAGPNNLFGNLTVTDPDAGENTLKLRISLSNATAGTISGGGFTDQGGGVYETTATLTETDANAALDNVQFTPTDNTGSSGSFSTDISVDVDDQGGGGYQQVLPTTEVVINRINDAPTLSLDADGSSGAGPNNYRLTFTEKDSPRLITDNDTDVSDADASFPTVELTISSVRDGNDETIILDGSPFPLDTPVADQTTSGGNYQVSLSTGLTSTILTISNPTGSNFSENEAEALLEAIQYQHKATDRPTEGERYIDILVSDGFTESNLARSTVKVIAVTSGSTDGDPGDSTTPVEDTGDETGDTTGPAPDEGLPIELIPQPPADIGTPTTGIVESPVTTPEQGPETGEPVHDPGLVNNPELSVPEQEQELKDLGPEKIIEDYKNTDSPVSREIGELLEEVLDGKDVTHEDLLDLLDQENLSEEAIRSNLLAFNIIQKQARTNLYSQAISELDQDHPNAFLEGFDDVTVSFELPKFTGQNIAILIGIDQYQAPIPSLATPIEDIKAINEVLSDNGYQSIAVVNPTYFEIIKLFQQLGNQLTESNNLIIYFAGHGYLNEVTGLGYWLASDAVPDSPGKWISTKDLSDFLEKLKSRQILMVADSCFSGSLTKEYQLTADSAGLSAEEILLHRSVMVMSSGGEEPVMDGGGDGHSVFARNFLLTLSQITSTQTGFDLFSNIRSEVTKVSPQIPVYGAMLSAGHEIGGDYLFNNELFNKESFSNKAPVETPAQGTN